MPDVASARLRVPVTLADAMPYLKGKASTLSAELDQLKSRLAALEPEWDSQAKDEYFEYKTLWEVSARDLMGPGGVLDQIAQVMGNVWSNYVDTEGACVKSWQHT